MNINNINRSVSILAIFTIVMVVSFNAFSQCNAPTYANNPSGCPGGSGVNKLIVTSYNSSTTAHRWYTTQSGSTYVNPSREGHPPGYSGAWTSELDGPFSGTVTYWVSGFCGGVETSRLPVTYGATSSGGITIAVTMNGSSVPPYNRCVGDQITLTASGGSSYSWSNGGSGSSITVSPTTNTTYTVTGYESVCNTTVSQSVMISVGPKVGPATVSGPTNACAGSTSTYSVSASNLNFYQFNISPSNAITAADNNTGQITWSSGFSGTATVSVTAFSPGSCAYSTTPATPVTVNIAPVPTTASAGPDQAQCPGPVTLAGNTPSSGSGLWTIVSGFGGSFGTIGNTTSTSSSPTARFNGSGLGGTYVLRWTISTGGGCPDSYDDVQITIHQPPFGANAGDYFIGSSTCGQSQVTLNASAPTLGTGSWSIVSGTGGNVTTPSSRTSTFTGTPGNTYILKWTVSSTYCGSVEDTTKVRFNRIPSTAAAGPDQTNSATCSLTSVTLAANSPSIGTGAWSVLSGSGGSFGNASASNSSFTGTPGVAYTLRWTTSNSPCAASTDDVNIKLNTLPAAAPTVSNNAKFGPGDITVTASGANTGAGETYEWIVSGNVSSGSSRLAPNIQSDINNYGTVSTVTTAGCKRTSPVNLFIYSIPVITASNPYVYLGSSSTLSTQTYDTYSWSTGSTTPTTSASTPGFYTVTVTKGGLSYTSLPFEIKSQMAGLNHNYIQTFVPQKEGINSSTILLEPVNNVNQSIQYFDGLGRPMQTVVTQGSPLKKDIVSPLVYDAFGREEYKYLPIVTGEDGRYKDNTTLIGSNKDYAANFYGTGTIADDNNLPFSRTLFESSPHSRVLKQGAPGSAWQPNDQNLAYSYEGDHAVKMDYQSNTTNEVRLWTSSISTAVSPLPLISTSSYYGPNQLIVKKTKDENHREVREYLDKGGKVVLKRVQAVESLTGSIDNDYASTYYIYDDLGQLVCVLQPEGTRLISSYLAETIPANKESFLQKWAFRYRYDSRMRMILKQVPGADSVRMVYDQRDRLVFTQDGNQRAAYKWSFTKYDVLNRPIITGVYTHAAAKTQREMTALLSTTVFGETFDGNADAAQHGYTNTVLVAPTFPTSGFDVHTVTYYDNHTFVSLVGSTEIPVADRPYLHNDVVGQYVVNTNQSFSRLRGQVTGMKVRVLEDTKFLWTINYFDDRYRVVQSVSSNHKGGVDRATSVYDFTGKVTKTKLTHHVGSSSNTIEKDFNYDHAGRLVKTWHKMNSRPSVILSALEYNELGQLVTKKLHASADNLIDKQGTVYSSSVLEVSQYNNEPNIIAKDAVVLKPGFTTAGKKVTVRTLTQWTLANSEPAPAAYAQVVDYRYNIRGWLTSINDVDFSATDYFSMKLSYQSTTGSANDQFNGNIGQIVWAATGFDKQDYRYKYDAMNRLKEAKYYNLTNGTKNDRFTETLLNPDGLTSSYDLNGNIKKLQRYGKLQSGYGLMDNLTYTYVKGNQLAQVDDAVAMNAQQAGFKESSSNDPTEYDYDANGNVKLDDNKAIQEITYNHLNLPVMVKKTATEYITYTYDASGRKLRQQVFGTQTKTTDYAGDFFYENDVLKFVNHEEGRIISSTIPAYEYFIKDHLGNVRTTFTTREEIEGNGATYEPSNLSNENSKFLRVTNARRVVSALFDRTNGSASGYSQRLTGGLNEKYGYARSIGVMPGDVVSAEVYAKYVDPTTSNWTAALASLMSQITATTPPGAVVVDGAAYATSTSSFTFGGLNGTAASTGAGPKAYLNWLVFDGDMMLLDGGYSRLSATPKEAGQDVAHERLSSGNITITKPGFVYVYLSNEEGTPLEVYFDDFRVDHTKSPIVQQGDYYPFGLTFNSYERESSVDQNNLYNGKELQEELGFDLIDYGARMYDMQTARWLVVDPLAESMEGFTVYGYAYNNPVSLVDIMGLAPGYSYNWDTGKYQETKKNGKSREVSFSEVESSLSAGGENNALVLRKSDIDGQDDAMTVMMDAAVKNTGMSVMIVSNSVDAAEKLEGLASRRGKIDNLTIANHSSYEEPYMFLGGASSIYRGGNLDKIKTDESLARIAGTLATNSNVILHSCFAGMSENGGTQFLKELALKLKTTVFANQSFAQSHPNMFNGRYVQKRTTGFLDLTLQRYPKAQEYNGRFTKVTVQNGEARATTVYDLRYTRTGGIQYSTSPGK